jgi:putative ABC transport system permease protein
VREKEIALRLALGASRFRLTRQFLTESVLLASLGAGFGLLLAVAGVRVLKTFVPSMILQIQTINIDAKVLVFTASVALFTGIAFGLAPALHASHSNLNDSLKEGGRDSAVGTKGNRLRGLLVIGEVAVSFILLIGAGLLINSFLHLRNLDPGFRADHLLTMKVDLPELKYPDGERRALFFDEVLRRIRALPGVQSVAVAGNLPFTYNGDSASIAVEGIPDPPPGQWPDVIFRAIGQGYFSTMGIPLVRGRDFIEQDKGDSKKVVVISEKTAQHYWPGKDPIGKRLKMGATTSDAPWREVIGVVKDVRQNDFIAEPKMQMYFDYRQLKDLAANALVVRTSVEPMTLATSVRNSIWAVDKDQPVAAIDTMDHIVSEAIARQRFSMLLLGLFATLALLLASVGIYGVMSYSVAQRTREIGIRIALGARRSDVLQMTVKQGLKLVGAGMILGIVAAFFLTRVLATLLFGISATDPLTFVGISLVLLAVAIIASYVPALRATRVDPITALRAQ